MIREYKTREQVLQGFRELFEWTYEVRFSPSDAARIDQQVLSGWSNTDESDLRLVKYIVHLHSLVAEADAWEMTTLRGQAKANLKSEFSRPASNDAARLLEVVHDVIETLAPKSTGVPRIVRASQKAAAERATASPAPARSVAGLAPQPPLDIHALKALLQQAAQQMPAHQAQSGQQLSPSGPQGHPAMMPMQPYVAPPVLAPAMPQLQQALAQAAPPPPDPNDPRVLLAQKEELERENLAILMKSAISKAKHDTSMKIIGNIG